jgi:hypothetical protein
MGRYITVFKLVEEDVPKLPQGFVNVEDAAIFLQVSDETVRRFIVEGELGGERQRHAHGPQGWRWVIPTRDVNRLKRVREALR